MTQLNASGQRVVPYAGYKFRVKEIGGDYFFAVNKVSALSRSVEVMEYREGGAPSLMRKSPGQAKYEAITLERGVELRCGSGGRGLARGFPQGSVPGDL